LKIIKLNAIDSTNNYLKQLAKSTSLLEPTVVVTQNQLSGRGQMGNSWVSRQGQSLTFSMFKLCKGLPADRQFDISMAVSIAIARVISQLNTPKVSVKWPNDIMSAKKKIGGILIENVLEGSTIKYAIIGIGLNINNEAFHHLPQAASLKMVTGNTFNVEEVFQKIITEVFKTLEDLSISNRENLKQEYLQNLFQIDKISVFETPNGKRFNGIVKGVSPIGELLVSAEDESLHKFQLKEVKLIY
tara:strand:+ start:3836 stop:4567 length:732 start_codon:yes stop_codon:yes gene_type:complete